jgi:hypothetical protein
MKPPIIINDNTRAEKSGDLSVYESIERAERALDYESAQDDQLHVYDSNGLLLRVVGNADCRGAHLEAVEIAPGHKDTLIAILIDFLTKLGEPKVKVDVMTLEELIAAAFKKAPNPYSG